MLSLSRTRKSVLISGALLVAVGMPLSLLAQQTLLNRLAADFLYFDGSEAVTAAPPPGISLYTKSVFVPASPVDNNTIYVTISTTGDTPTGGTSHLFSCTVDGQFCNAGTAHSLSGPPFPGPFPGWVNLQHEPANQMDNSIHYTWCMKTSPGTHTVQVRMASSVPPNSVAIETAHFYIESNKIALGATTGCSQGTP